MYNFAEAVFLGLKIESLHKISKGKMMKKGLIIASLAAAAFLSGCGGGGGGGNPPPPVTETTLFLIDQDGYSLGGVPYSCDSGSGVTAPNGEFTFYPPDDCIFDFTGFDGNYDNDPYVDDIIYIVDDLDDGKGGIDYDCYSFGAGTTYGDGSFDYDIDDECVFYL